MRILVLGGSNTGLRSGWAQALKTLLPEHEVENSFLGAVGSLFALLRLLKRKRERLPKPDVVILEYSLNDTLLLTAGNITIWTIWDTLHAIMTYCARHRIRPLFLCLSLRPVEASTPDPGHEMNVLYAAVAKARGAADCVTHAGIFGEIDLAHYGDSMHLTEHAALRVAEALAARLRQPIPIPTGWWRPIAFAYVCATQARATNPSALRYVESSVFAGPFLKLNRGDASYWKLPGRPMALMLRSTETSGIYRVRLKEADLRKNAQSVMRRNVSKLMTLQYLTKDCEAGAEFIVDMPSSEEELMNLEHDFTPMEQPPLVPFAAQTVEINGVMCHRPPLLAQLVREPAFRRALKRVSPASASCS